MGVVGPTTPTEGACSGVQHALWVGVGGSGWEWVGVGWEWVGQSVLSMRSRWD